MNWEWRVLCHGTGSASHLYYGPVFPFLNPDLGFQMALSLPEWALGGQLRSRSWGQSEGNCPFLPSRLGSESQCPGILRSRHPFKTGRGKQECALYSLFLGTWGSGMGQGKRRGCWKVWMQVPHWDTSEESTSSLSSLSFLCEEPPQRHIHRTPPVPGSCCSWSPPKGSLPQQDGLQVGRYP